MTRLSHAADRLITLFWRDLCWKSRLALALILTSFILGRIFGAQP
jgi:hypothetical protein